MTLVKAPAGVLHRPTVNRYLSLWHLDQDRLLRQPPAVRFQAEHSNDCWQFDMSPSDLKYIESPEWVDAARGRPTLMLFSVVDDRSGVAYQEYRCVYGEDAESALRFLFNALARTAEAGFPFEGRPKMLYLDNGPVAKSRVFQNVMLALGVEWQTHVPAGKDGTRVTARAKGKVERPFRTVKEAHETLYHFHKPETEHQANEWLMRYLLRYNDQPHRLYVSDQTSTVESDRRESGQTGPCSLISAGASKPVSEYIAHDHRAGQPEARTVTRAGSSESAFTSKGSVDHVCYLSGGGHRRGQGARGCRGAGRQAPSPAF